MHKKNCGCEPHINCGCEQPIIQGCRTKVDLLCTTYTGVELETLDVQPGENANNIFKKINDAFEDLPAPNELDVIIENVGGEVPVYKGINLGTFVHEFKTLVGENGIIVRDKDTTDCDNGGNVVEILIDENWLLNYLNNWILGVNLCPLISNCGGTPVQPPVAQPLVFNLPNQTGKTFAQSDFNFSDPNGGGTFASFRLIGTTTNFRIGTQIYTSNTEVPVSALTQGQFKFVAPVSNQAQTTTVNYQMRSTTGEWSNATTLTINNAEKVLVVLSPVSVELTRDILNNKIATVNYTNGTGQQFSAGTNLVSVTGTVGQPGYRKITFLNTTTLNGSGSFDIRIEAIPYNTIINNPATISYTLDTSQGVINLTYMSIPVVNNDILKTTPHLTIASFTVNDFTSNSSDLDGDIVEARILPITTSGIVSSLTGYLYNGTQYDGSWMLINTLNQVSYQPDNVTNAYTKRNKWQVRDSQGNISV